MEPYPTITFSEESRDGFGLQHALLRLRGVVFSAKLHTGFEYTGSVEKVSPESVTLELLEPIELREIPFSAIDTLEYC